jgi:hypothetical protein
VFQPGARAADMLGRMSGDRSTTESRQLRCPSCDYDLHGQQIAADDVVRCPECGAVTSLNIIAATLVHRRRRERRVFADLMIALALFAAAMLLSIVLGDLLPRDEMALRARFLFSAMAPTVALPAVLFFYLLATWAWDHLSRLRRLGFAVTTVLTILLTPVNIVAFVFVAWLIGFHVWAVRRI